MIERRVCLSVTGGSLGVGRSGHRVMSMGLAPSRRVRRCGNSRSAGSRMANRSVSKWQCCRLYARRHAMKNKDFLENKNATRKRSKKGWGGGGGGKEGEEREKIFKTRSLFNLIPSASFLESFGPRLLISLLQPGFFFSLSFNLREVSEACACLIAEQRSPSLNLGELTG